MSAPQERLLLQTGCQFLHKHAPNFGSFLRFVHDELNIPKDGFTGRQGQPIYELALQQVVQENLTEEKLLKEMDVSLSSSTAHLL